MHLSANTNSRTTPRTDCTAPQFVEPSVYCDSKREFKRQLKSRQYVNFCCLLLPSRRTMRSWSREERANNRRAAHLFSEWNNTRFATPKVNKINSALSGMPKSYSEEKYAKIRAHRLFLRPVARWRQRCASCDVDPWAMFWGYSVSWGHIDLKLK